VDYACKLDKRKLRAICKTGVVVGGQRKCGPIILDDPGLISRRDPFEFIYGKYDTSPRLQDLYEKYGTAPRIPFRGTDRLKLIVVVLEARRREGGCELDLGRLEDEGIIEAFYPLHCDEEKQQLKQAWMVRCALPNQQPLDEIKDYFGEKIGLYFAWLAHYTTWLAVPAVLGLAVTVDVWVEKSADAKAVPFFGLLMCVWSTAFLESWKRRNSVIAMEWGMHGYENQEVDRPQFSGDAVDSHVEGTTITWFSPAEATRRVIQSVLLSTAVLLLVMGMIGGIFYFRFWSVHAGAGAITNPVDGSNLGPPMAGVMNAVQIQVMNAVYQSLAEAMNDYEYHRTDTAYEDSLIAKVFAFQVFNSFASMFYIAFVKSAVGDECLEANCMQELSTGLMSIFITRMVTGNVTEIGVPWVKRRAQQRRERRLADAGLVPCKKTEAELQFALPVYETKGIQCFEDYAEMVMQFGYVSLFVTAFPLAPLLAAANNYVEVRVDGAKLLDETRRPEPRGAEDIGTWGVMLDMMSTASVLTNAALICFTARATMGGMGTSSKLVAFIAIEHAVMLIKAAVGVLVPDVPEDVAVQLSRQEYIVRKLILLEQDETDEVAVMAMCGDDDDGGDGGEVRRRAPTEILEIDESIPLGELDECFNNILI
jgi:anoctamin-10/anoctamin-7